MERIDTVLKEAFSYGLKARDTEERSNRGFGYTLLLIAPVAIIVFGVQLALYCFDVVRKKADAVLLERLSGWLFLLATVLLTALVVMVRIKRRKGFDRQIHEFEEAGRKIIEDNRVLLSALEEKYWLPLITSRLVLDYERKPEDIMAELKKNEDDQLKFFVEEAVRRRLLQIPDEQAEEFPGLFR